MKCEACGFENEQAFSYCPNCDVVVTSAATPVGQPVNTAAERVLAALKDPLFLVLCILMSVSCGVGLISTGLNVLMVLFTIFLWLVYAQASKGIADAAHLRRVSGTVYAQYIIMNVCAVLLVVIGAICGLAFGTLLSDTAFVNEMLAALDMSESNIFDIQEMLGAVSGTIIFVVFALMGVIMLVVNIFSLRYVHRFAKSVYESVQAGKLELKHTQATYVWLIIFAICSGFSLLGNLGSGDVFLLASGAASCAMPVIAAILIKKYFMTEV